MGDGSGNDDVLAVDDIEALSPKNIKNPNDWMVRMMDEWMNERMNKWMDEWEGKPVCYLQSDVIWQLDHKEQE